MSQSQNPKRAAPEPVTTTLNDPARNTGRMKQLGGSQSDDWNRTIANDTIQALWFKNSGKETSDQQTIAAIKGLVGIGPKDELEGMMAAQLIAAHSAAMECYRRAMIGEQTFEGRRENLNQANKLSRSFAVLLDALNRHRGKGQQRVTVEHVHVHAGGQAVVGAVATPGGGERARSEEQPHAKQIGHAAEPAMRIADTEREPLPIARDAERSLPDARWTIAGGAEGK
jgi:hypothetical protein